MAAIQPWRDFIGWSGNADISAAATDMWPKRKGIVARRVDGRTALDVMTWGVPLTVSGKRLGSTITKHVTNVRNLSSPFWRSMLGQPAQRCFVPFSAFAEPQLGAGRAEHWFTIRERPIAAFAGIWRASDEGNVFAFLTCEPNPLIAPLHPKAMPVILEEADYDAWLDGAPAADFAKPYPSQLMSIA